MALPAQEELRRLYDYDATRGTLVHKSTHGRALAGATIGLGIHYKGYITARVHLKHFKIHRLIWVYFNGPIPVGMQIDHINRVRKDNHIENLRLATPLQNARNRNRSRNNTSGYTGVYWRKNRKRWVVEIRIDGKDRRIGSFKEIADAIARRKTAERQLEYFPDQKEKATPEGVAGRLAA